METENVYGSQEVPWYNELADQTVRNLYPVIRIISTMAEKISIYNWFETWSLIKHFKFDKPKVILNLCL